MADAYAFLAGVFVGATVLAVGAAWAGKSLYAAGFKHGKEDRRLELLRIVREQQRKYHAATVPAQYADLVEGWQQALISVENQLKK